ncbi:exosome complex component RRP46-like [Actinia tenebrosa]|uniref:Exosome complex component RRP46 n=1 Tax=Actinia tenebrosa TaxID=6105 RepID=A0A6P8J3V5_ACTTE|nr:exosome complex component RRP46-like [Actinia tenebrosa]
MEIETERAISEIRAMYCEQDLLSQTDGSASFKQGATRVIAAAYGPVEVRSNKELLDKSYVEVIFRTKVGLPGCAEKSLEQIIKKSCEPVILTSLHPRSALTIIVQVVQNSGSLFSCAVNAACMAMIDAGYPMRCTVASVTCALMDNNEIQLDPTLEQEQEASAVLTFVFDSIKQSLLTSSTKGMFTIEQFNQCLSACKEASGHIFKFFRQSVERKLSKDAKYQNINTNPLDT